MPSTLHPVGSLEKLVNEVACRDVNGLTVVRTLRLVPAMKKGLDVPVCSPWIRGRRLAAVSHSLRKQKEFWLLPHLQAEVSYSSVTAGMLRHGILKGLRFDLETLQKALGLWSLRRLRQVREDLGEGESEMPDSSWAGAELDPPPHDQLQGCEPRPGCPRDLGGDAWLLAERVIWRGSSDPAARSAWVRRKMSSRERC